MKVTLPIMRLDYRRYHSQVSNVHCTCNIYMRAFVCACVFTAGYSVIGWNHPGFAESTVSDFII